MIKVGLGLYGVPLAEWDAVSVELEREEQRRGVKGCRKQRLPPGWGGWKAKGQPLAWQGWAGGKGRAF